MTLEDLDWDRLKQLCPLVNPNFFDWVMSTNFKDLSGSGFLLLKEGFEIPFPELPRHINHPERTGLIKGVVRYRLEVGC